MINTTIHQQSDLVSTPCYGLQAATRQYYFSSRAHQSDRLVFIVATPYIFTVALLRPLSIERRSVLKLRSDLEFSIVLGAYWTPPLLNGTTTREATPLELSHMIMYARIGRIFSDHRLETDTQLDLAL